MRCPSLYLLSYSGTERSTWPTSSYGNRSRSHILHLEYASPPRRNEMLTAGSIDIPRHNGTFPRAHIRTACAQQRPTYLKLDGLVNGSCCCAGDAVVQVWQRLASAAPGAIAASFVPFSPLQLPGVRVIPFLSVFASTRYDSIKLRCLLHNHPVCVGFCFYLMQRCRSRTVGKISC